MSDPQDNPEFIDWHCEIAMQALDGAAWQCAAAARFLSRGDVGPAIETYKRVIALFKEFVTPELKVIASASTSDQEGGAAVEFRRQRDAGRKPEAAPVKRSA